MTAPRPATTRPTLMNRLPMHFGELRRTAFGSTVRRHRVMCRLELDVLAHIAGLDADYLAAVEEDHLMPDLDIVFALADALGTDAAELLHDTRTETERLVVEQWLHRHPDSLVPEPSMPSHRAATPPRVQHRAIDDREDLAAVLPLGGRRQQPVHRAISDRAAHSSWIPERRPLAP